MAFHHSQQAAASTSEPIDIQRGVWSRFKDIIEDLYINQDLKLNSIKVEMERMHGFKAMYNFDVLRLCLSLTYPASIPQYKRKLHDSHFKKNKKSTEWQAVSRSLKRRNLASDDALVYTNGRAVDSKRLKRA